MTLRRRPSGLLLPSIDWRTELPPLVGMAGTVRSLGGKSYFEAIRPDGPAGFWQLAELSGTTAHEAIANRNGTISGTGVTPGQPPVVGDLPSMAFAAGSTPSIVSPSTFTLSPPLTMECWAKVTVPDHFILMGYALATNGLGMAIGNTTADSAGSNFFGLAQGSAWMLPSVAITSGTHHFALVLSSSGGGNFLWTFYVDGLAVGTAGPAAWGGAGNTNIAVNMGYDPSVSTRYMTGNLGGVALYLTALSAAQILAHYNAGIASAGQA